MHYARLPTGTILKKAFKSPNPALNVHHCNEPVACDIIYSDVPAIHNGSIAAVIFAGLTTQVTDVYGIKRDSQFVNTLEDNIIQHGAPNKLISDRAKVIISNKLKKYFELYVFLTGKANFTSSTKTLVKVANKQ